MSESKTRDEARRRAVEAAQGEYLGTWHGSTSEEIAEAMVAAFERAMADAGWRMVRVVAAIEGVGELMVADNDRMRHAMVAARAAGWNACRAAMLGDE